MAELKQSISTFSNPANQMSGSKTVKYQLVCCDACATSVSVKINCQA